MVIQAIICQLLLTMETVTMMALSRLEDEHIEKQAAVLSVYPKYVRTQGGGSFSAVTGKNTMCVKHVAEVFSMAD